MMRVCARARLINVFAGKLIAPAWRECFQREMRKMNSTKVDLPRVGPIADGYGAESARALRNQEETSSSEMKMW